MRRCNAVALAGALGLWMAAPAWAQESEAPAAPDQAPEAEVAPEAATPGEEAKDEDAKYEDAKYEDAKYEDAKYEDAKYEDAAATPAAGAESAAGAGVLANLLDAAGIELKLRGKISGSLQYRVEERSAGLWYDEVHLRDGISRYETSLNLRLRASAGSFRGVADIDVDWLGYGDRSGDFTALSRREEVFPVRMEAHALYLEATDLLLDGLDLRVGQQLAQWGVADQFNPTNTLNPEDLENVLRFGDQAANFMVRADYSFLTTWSVSAVVAPIFRPAILPTTARLGVTAVDRQPFLDSDLRRLLAAERLLGERFGYGTRVAAVSTQTPRPALENAQYMLRVGGEVWGHDLGLSYFRGHHDIPVPIKIHTSQSEHLQCNPDDESQCLDGTLDNTVTVAYPRMHVVGLNLAGELPFAIGYRFELGIYLPDRRRARLTSDTLNLGLTHPAGEYDYPAGERPLVVSDAPFAKWTLGLDYSVGRHFMFNVMWVHGMADELGSGDFFHGGFEVRGGGANPGRAPLLDCSVLRDGHPCTTEVQRPKLGDYLVLGVDFRFHDQAGLVRLFAIFEVSGYQFVSWDLRQREDVVREDGFFSEAGFSAVIYPEIAYTFGGGFELGGGALIQLGARHTKFGDATAGGSLLFVRGQYVF